MLAEEFKERDVVDVIGTSKGRGFAGLVKRHHFRGGPASTAPCFIARRARSVHPASHPAFFPA